MHVIEKACAAFLPIWSGDVPVRCSGAMLVATCDINSRTAAEFLYINISGRFLHRLCSSNLPVSKS